MDGYTQHMHLDWFRLVFLFGGLSHWIFFFFLSASFWILHMVFDFGCLSFFFWVIRSRADIHRCFAWVTGFFFFFFFSLSPYLLEPDFWDGFSFFQEGAGSCIIWSFEMS